MSDNKTIADNNENRASFGIYAKNGVIIICRSNRIDITLGNWVHQPPSA